MSAQPQDPHQEDPRDAEIARLMRAVELIHVDLENAEASLRVERRKNTELKKKLEDKAVGEDFAPEIRAAFDYWRMRCDHPRAKLGLERAAAVKARLKSGHSLEEVMRAIDGAAWDAYVNEETGKRYDELELICRNEVKFDRFLDTWGAIIRRGKVSLALNAYCLPAGVSAAVYDFMDGGWRWKCPSCRLGWDLDHTPLLIGRNGFIYCEGLCVGVTLEMIREALLEHFPRVTTS